MKSFHVVQNIPSPYRLHLFAEMQRQLAEYDISFHVHFMSDMSRGHGDRPLSWRNPVIAFPHTYWRDYGFGCHHFNPGMIRHLRKARPDFLLVGSPFDTFTGIAVAWMCPAKVRCTWSEGNTKTPGIMTGFKGWLKRKVFSKYDFVGVPGSDAVKYIALHQSHTKCPMPKPIMLPNLIDEKRFRPRSQWDKEELQKIRLELGVGDGERLAITPARLAPCKGLIEYLSLITPAMIDGWRIAILGQGSLKEALLQLTRERGIGERVTIKDFVPYAEMPKYYAAADLFVLPSRHDPNPLSVVEALHSGLPVAVSEMTGNVDEAVTAGRNGWVLPVKQADLYSQKLQDIFSTDRLHLQKMGKYSEEENAQFWNSEKSINSFLSVLGVKSVK